MKKEENPESKKIINLNDRKIMFVLAFVFIVGTLFNVTLTGNAGRIGVITQLENNEFRLYEGNVERYMGSLIKMETISEDGAIKVTVMSGLSDIYTRTILAGQENNVGGFFITNVAMDSKDKAVLIRINTKEMN